MDLRARTTLLASILLVTMALAPSVVAHDGTSAGTTAHCGVPCGYIYPLIVIEPEESKVWHLPQADKVEVTATLTWKFDVVQEGFTLNDPTDPITVGFEFPRKPGWAGIEVEPNQFEIPIQPQYIQPDPEDPNDPQAEYRYSREITITFTQKGQATLEPGRDHARLLVFAKSTESGLYKPSYGIKEFRMDPEGAIVKEEATADASGIVDVGPTDLVDQVHDLGTAQVRLTPLAAARVFQPTPFLLTISGGPNDQSASHVRMGATLMDEEGTALYSTGDRHIHGGRLPLNLTFPEPGTYRLLVHASPMQATGFAWDGATVAFPITIGHTTDSDGVRLGNEYTATYVEPVPEVSGDARDPAGQYEKFIPIPVYDGASSAAFAFFLGSQAMSAQGPTGAANLNVDVLGPDDGVLAQGTFDPANPTLRLPVSGLPGPGLYHLHVYGAGLNPDNYGGAVYEVDMAIAYDEKPVIDAVRDGRLDPANATRLGNVGLRLAGADVAPWQQGTVTLELTDGEGATVGSEVEAKTTVTTDEGTIVRSGGWRTVSDGSLDVSFTPHGPGVHLVHVLLASPAGDPVHFQPISLALPVIVGSAQDARVELPTTYAATLEATVDPAAVVPTPPNEPDHVRVEPVPVHEGVNDLSVAVSLGAAPSAASLEVLLVAPDGTVLDEVTVDGDATSATLAATDLDPGRHVVLVKGYRSAGATYGLDVAASYAIAPVVDNPLVEDVLGRTAGGDDAANPVPGPATVMAVLVLAGAALALRRD